MNWTHPLFIIAGATGLCFLVAGLLLWKRPPKSINDLYGYRTKQSKRSQEAWDFAQPYAGKRMTISGIILLVVGFLATLLPEMDEFLSIVIALSVTTFFPLFSIAQTERELGERFGGK